MRVSDLVAGMHPASGLTSEGYQHLSFRFIAGPVERYERGGGSWMLHKPQAGRGAALNLGVHFIDLISTLTSAPITSVSAQTRAYRPDVTVEEQAVFTC